MLMMATPKDLGVVPFVGDTMMEREKFVEWVKQAVIGWECYYISSQDTLF